MITLTEIGKRAVKAKYILQSLDTEQKNMALRCISQCLKDQKDFLLSANQIDMENAQKAKMHSGLMDRLQLTEDRILSMADGLLQIASLPDPIGDILETIQRPNGLVIQKRRVPLGVIGIIYESRPNVTADAFGLCFKTGNAVILKGGSDAISTNIAIVKIIRDALATCNIVPDAIQLLENTDRSITQKFMRMNQYVDVLIPRGGAGLIRSVVENSTIPVIETGTGNCHIYVDKFADLDMAINIIFNAKTQRIGVCNACESLVIHKDVREAFLPKLAKRLQEKDVELRCDPDAREILKDAIPATEEDFATEYLDYILSIKTVNNVEEAIEHINKYNTKHSESIISQDEKTCEKFLQEIDAACVYANASTRFTDGFEFGFGAEIGISTQKLHARGPMGLKELTSYKYTIIGTGQIRQ